MAKQPLLPFPATEEALRWPYWEGRGATESARLAEFRKMLQELDPEARAALLEEVERLTKAQVPAIEPQRAAAPFDVAEQRIREVDRARGIQARPGLAPEKKFARERLPIQKDLPPMKGQFPLPYPQDPNVVWNRRTQQWEDIDPKTKQRVPRRSPLTRADWAKAVSTSSASELFDDMNAGLTTEDLERIYKDAGIKVPMETVDIETVPEWEPTEGKLKASGEYQKFKKGGFGAVQTQRVTRPNRAAMVKGLADAITSKEKGRSAQNRALDEALYSNQRALPRHARIGVFAVGRGVDAASAEGTIPAPQPAQRRAGESDAEFEKRQQAQRAKWETWNKARLAERKLEKTLGEGSRILSSEEQLNRPSAYTDPETGRAVQVRDPLKPMLPPELRKPVAEANVANLQPGEKGFDEEKLTADERAKSFQQRTAATRLPLEQPGIVEETGVARQDLPEARRPGPAAERHPAEVKARKKVAARGGHLPFAVSRTERLRLIGGVPTAENPSGVRLVRAIGPRHTTMGLVDHVGRQERVPNEGRRAQSGRVTGRRPFLDPFPEAKPLDLPSDKPVSPLVSSRRRMKERLRRSRLKGGHMVFTPRPGAEKVEMGPGFDQSETRFSQIQEPLEKELRRTYGQEKAGFAIHRQVPNPGNVHSTPQPQATPYRGLRKIISGGQTGADLAGLMAAEKLGIETGGTAPKGFRTEIGDQPILGERYKLAEHARRDWIPRTIQNIKDADATVVFVEGNPKSLAEMKPGGSKRTVEEARRLGKPVIVNPSRDRLRKWMADNRVETLNVAGSRRSGTAAGFESRVMQHLESSLREPIVASNIETRVAPARAIQPTQRYAPGPMARRAQVNWAKLQELRKSGYFEKLRKLSTGKMRPGVAKGSLGILLGLALLPIMAAAGDE